ncbi:hypothetical protein RDWZM_007638 [Blomia tropicalis]|uniref:Protein transport protein Sec61 subunit beta n=1 Tax=Blomia tropicalis TaxID=40697 RepID=A0A9Q0M048_BLOTA|nr:hypothetical protein RDWZM_007638 [Blomia tropicalis]
MKHRKPASPSSTSVGAGGTRAAPRTMAAGGRAGGGTVRQRKVGTSSAPSGRSRPGQSGAGGGMWRFYTDDSPGIKVGPVPVLVMSLAFIASVFMLHIWGKYTRA